jgi:TP901 family phage tail tape measure protein
MTSPSGGSGGGDLGTVRGKILIDATDAKKGSEQAASAVEDFQKKADASNEKAKKSAASFAKGYGLVVAGGIALAINAAKDFDQALADVSAAGGKDAAGQMDLIRQKALQLGADTKFSATEAAQAMEALVKAGLSVTDVLNGGADAAVALAAAEGIDIPTAAEIAASAMTAFGLKASELPGIANKISQAASATKMDVNDFSYAMNQAGAVSKLVGLSFDDMSLAIVAMGKAGIVGSDAGTSLKTFLMNLQPQTKKQTNLMKDLGIVTKEGANRFFDATGHIKSMADISEVLFQALKKLTPAQKQQALETMFGSDAIRAGAIIAEQGAAGMAKLTDEMNNQLSVSDKAKVKQDTLSGAIEKMKGSVETAAIKIGTTMIPTLKAIAGFIETVADWFAKLPGPVQQALIWFGVASVGLIGIGLAVGVVVKAFNALKLAFEILKVAMMDNPWILIAVALVALVILIISKWDEIKKALSVAWNWIKKTAESIWGGIADFFDTVLGAIGDAFSAAWQAVKTAAETAWNAIVTFLSTIWQAIVAAVWPILSPIITVLKAIWDVIWAIISGVANVIWAILEGLWSRISAATIGAWTLISDFFTMIWGKIMEAWHLFWDPFAKLMEDVWTVVSDVATKAWTVISTMLSAAWENIRNAASAVWSAISGVFKSAFADIGNSISNGVGDAKNKLGELISWLGGLASDAWDWLVDAGANLMKGMYNGILDGLRWLKDKIVGVFSDMVDGIKDFFGISSPSKLFAEYGKFTVQGYIVGAEAMKKKLNAKMTAVMSMADTGMAISPAAGSAAPSAAVVGQMAAATTTAVLPAPGEGSKTFVINNLTVPIQSNLDPTDPVQWRKAMVAIRDGINNVQREYGG